MLDYFSMLAEQVLHDPNSPLRTTSSYIPVLRVKCGARGATNTNASPRSTIWRWPCRMAVGASGQRFPLYASPQAPRETSTGCCAEYVLLFITNPGCPMVPRDPRGDHLVADALREMIERAAESAGDLSRRGPHGVARLPRPHPCVVDQRL